LGDKVGSFDDAGFLPFVQIAHVDMVSLLYLENLLRCEDFQLDFLSRIVGNLEVVIPFYVEIANPDKSLNNLLRFSFLNDQNNIIFRASNYGDPKNDWSTVGYPIGIFYYATFSN
jgi:hypothetical protein